MNDNSQQREIGSHPLFLMTANVLSKEVLQALEEADPPTYEEGIQKYVTALRGTLKRHEEWGINAPQAALCMSMVGTEATSQYRKWCEQRGEEVEE